jgi:hypothetical protein
LVAAFVLVPTAALAANDKPAQRLPDGRGFRLEASALQANIRDDGSFSANNNAPVQMKLRGSASGRSTAVDGGVVVDSDDGSSQWFIQTPNGIEHLLVVEPPTEPGEAVYTIDVTGLQPVLGGEGNVALVDEAGLQRYSYRGLAVWDAYHRAQTAWFETTRGGIEIHVETDDSTVGPLTIDPLVNVFTYVTGVGGTEFGSSVSVADVNGDNINDVLVGQPLWTSGENREGRAQIFYGLANGGLNTVAAFSFEPNVIAANCGRSVALVDVDGDGLRDVVSGCSRDLSVAGAMGLNAGRGGLRVHRNTGTSTAPVFATAPSVTFVHSGDLFEYVTLHVLADNIDNTGGVEIFATGLQNGVATHLHMYRYASGSAPVQRISLSTVGIHFLAAMTTPTGRAIAAAAASQAKIFNYATATQLLNTTPTVVGTAAGTTTNIATGDINKDGFSDIVLGMPFLATANIHLSDASGVFAAPLVLTGPQEFGSAVAVGDANADTYPDVVVCDRGIPAAGGTGSSCVMYGGSPAGLNFSVDRFGGLITGTQIGDIGEIPSFAAIRDSIFEGTDDGSRDLILPRAAQSNFQVVEFAAANIRDVNDLAPESDLVNAGAGSSVAMGDVTNDGIDDLIVGASGYNGGRGAVFVYFGGPAADAIPDWCTWSTAQEQLGSAVTVAKVRGSTQAASLIIGASDYSVTPVSNSREGRVAVFHGPLLGGSCNIAGNIGGGAASQIITGSVVGGFFGSAVANAGNAINNNGDGIAVGSPCGKAGSCSRVTVIPSGGVLGLTPASAIVFNGSDAAIGCTSFGTSIAAAANIDTTDGRADILVGAPYCDSNGYLDNGKVFVLRSAAAAPLVTVSTWTYRGSQNDMVLGTSVATVGDVNNDGRADVAIGAPGYDRVGLNVVDGGVVYVFHGRAAAGFTTGSNTELHFSSNGMRGGEAIAGGKDFNYDGIADLVVGLGDSAGAVQAFFGSSTGVIVNRKFNLNGAGTEGFGRKLAVGDLRGDSYGDFAAGATGYANAQTGEGRVVVRTGAW